MQIQNQIVPVSSWKRKCISYKPNDIFDPFQQALDLIIQNYQKNSENSLINGLTILVGQIRQMDKQSNLNSTPIKKKLNIKNQIKLNKQMFTCKKQIPSFNQDPQQQQQQTNPESQIRQIVILQKTGKKIDKSKKKVQFCLPDKDIRNQTSKTKKHLKLINSLNKLSMHDNKFNLQNQIQNCPDNANKQQKRQTEQSNLMSFDEQNFKKKSINQLLQQSSKKIQQDKMITSIFNLDSESDYQMTDHQSNQSDSDQGNYQQQYVYEKEEPLFGTIFTGMGMGMGLGKNLFNKNMLKGGLSSNLNLPKLNLKSLLNSPKKTKSKKKRLFINKKKVPRWAQDLKQVQNKFASDQQINLRQKYNSIFGTCIIQNLQTNTVFNLKDIYTRASTARWQKSKNGFVI